MTYAKVNVTAPNGQQYTANINKSTNNRALLEDLVQGLHLDRGRDYEIGIMFTNAAVRPLGELTLDDGDRLVLIEKGRTPLSSSTTFTQPMHGDPFVQIYQVSDLHFPQKRMVDQKSSFGSELDTQIGNLPHEIFEQFLHRNADTSSGVAKFLIITGDLARSAGYNELREAVEFIKKTKELIRPAMRDDQVVIVPGNHDVNWTIAQNSQHPSEKFDTFKSRIRDASEKYVLPASGTASKNPCKFYPSYGLLIYALNSCLLGGVVKEDIKDAQLAKSDLEMVKQVLTSQYAGDASMIQATQRAITRLRKISEASYIMDAGLVGKDCLNRIPRDLQRLRQSLRSAEKKDLYDRSLRIAVLHHHISPFSPIETKEFEELVDASTLKSILFEQGFHLVLHGHKHQPKITRESIITKGGERSLSIISAGSLGDWQSGSGFNIINLSNPLADDVLIQVDAVKMALDSTSFEHDLYPAFTIHKANGNSPTRRNRDSTDNEMELRIHY